MKRLAVTASVIVLALTGASARAAAPARAAKPTEPVALAGCVTADCHPGVKAHKALHGPVSANACDSCHVVVDPKAHTFRLIRQKAEMCTFCHDFARARKPVVHKPAARGECLACHDPHGGATRTSLRDEDSTRLCAHCHDTTGQGKKFMHYPAAKGACDSCHAPHASNYPKLLDAVGTDLCLHCHRDFDRRMAKAPFRHKAVDLGCDKCHDPHGSNFPMGLRQNIKPLCLSCHEKVKDRIAAAQDKHTPIMSDSACITCHTPHGGNLARGMRDLPAKICMTCHDKPITSAKGQPVLAVPEITDAKLHKHGPIREGQCGGCHNVHGSDRPLLLDEAYSSSFYNRAVPENYALCMKCHDSRLAADPKGPTGFRNGQKNLHFVHVAKDRRDHNCRACHITHASANDRLVRDWTTFGKWQMPIAFRKTDTGGTCTSGCHVPWAYDRQNPVPAPTNKSAPTSMPAGGPAPIPAARPLSDAAVMIAWSANDLLGNRVTVPDPAKPTILLFAGPDAKLAAQLFKGAAAALTDPQAARIVIVAAGPAGPNQATLLALAKETLWPVVADPAGDICLRSEVRGWPVTLVVRPDALQVARIDGAPENLTLRLAPYLAAAALKQPATQPAEPDVVGDSRDRHVIWQVHLARKYLADAQPQAAADVLAQALKTFPDSIPLRLAMIDALTQLKQAPAALQAIDSLAANSVPAARLSLLRGKALLAQGQLEPAKAALAAALQADPNLAEVHYVLGLVHEAAKDFQRAAEEFRLFHDAQKP